MGLATTDPHCRKVHTEIHKIPKFGVYQARYICYSPALVGQYWEKLCPRSRVRPEAAPVLETEGTVFSNTDRPRPVNNISIYF